MNVDDEFATVDLILASKAETRAVDAFALALIKAERQMRKLFTYLVFQSDAFDATHIGGLRNVLASHSRVYFVDFVSAWDKLYARPFREIVGPDYDHLHAVLTKATGYRNKIFHGQLTTEHLSREDLMTYVAEITKWCRIVAESTRTEIGYDGFTRNSFRKSESVIKGRLIGKISTLDEYDQFLAQMEEERLQRHKSGQELAKPPVRSPGAPRRNPVRDLDQIGLGKALVNNFPEWLAYFEHRGPFTRTGQLEHHIKTIQRRYELGSAVKACSDELFLKSLYETLRAWGIGVRRSRLKPFDEFAAVFAGQQQRISYFETILLDDPQLDILETSDALWALLSQLSIAENDATLVPVTKALHHALPELVVPIDRAYTQLFFGWQNPQFQYSQRQCFAEAFNVFAQVARVVKPSQYVGKGWNSSRTKVIDNAVVGLIRSLKDKVKSLDRI
jgi:hypothetical protein